MKNNYLENCFSFFMDFVKRSFTVFINCWFYKFVCIEPIKNIVSYMKGIWDYNR